METQTPRLADVLFSDIERQVRAKALNEWFTRVVYENGDIDPETGVSFGKMVNTIRPELRNGNIAFVTPPADSTEFPTGITFRRYAIPMSESSKPPFSRVVQSLRTIREPMGEVKRLWESASCAEEYAALIYILPTVHVPETDSTQLDQIVQLYQYTQSHPVGSALPSEEYFQSMRSLHMLIGKRASYQEISSHITDPFTGTFPV